MAEYSDTTNVSICCATWNVNTRLLGEDADLKDWLIHQLHSCADIYAIAFQEIVDLNVRNVVLDSKKSDDMAQYWQKAVHSTITQLGMDYRLIFEKHMVGLQLLVFARQDHCPYITDVRHAVIYTGGYGVTGNKGGIAVRMDFHDSPICFVGAHFHANRDNVATRNMDCQTIIEQAVFLPSAKNTNGVNELNDVRPYSATFKAMKSNISWTLLQHEYVFWFGDLNYRICSDVDDESVFATVLQGDWPALRNVDQLNMERESGNVFHQFNEGVINFPPTYKYQPGTDSYEQRPNKKLRAPAWCDRILWRCAGAKDDVRLQAYDAIRLNISDHKPVVAWFECSIKTFIQDRVRSVYQELLFAVDKWVNASTPKMAVDNRIIDFGDVLINVSPALPSSLCITVINLFEILPYIAKVLQHANASQHGQCHGGVGVCAAGGQSDGEQALAALRAGRRHSRPGRDLLRKGDSTMYYGDDGIAFRERSTGIVLAI